MRDYLVLNIERNKRLDFSRVRLELDTDFTEIKQFINELGRLDDKDRNCIFREGETKFLSRVKGDALKKTIREAWENLEKEVKRYAENDFYSQKLALDRAS